MDSDLFFFCYLFYYEFILLFFLSYLACKNEKKNIKQQNLTIKISFLE